MKIVNDFSVTSAPLAYGDASAPWDGAWASPSSGVLPGMVLDFAADIYGAGGIQSSLGGLVSLNRPSAASFTGSGGLLETAGVDTHRLTHDPDNLAKLGLLLEPVRTNLLAGSDAPVDQSAIVTGVIQTLSFYGTGTVTLSGAHVETIVGAGVYPVRTSVSFTPIAGSLDLAFFGDVTGAQLEEGAQASSYIATIGGPATRDNDEAIVALGPWFQPSAGTFVFSGHLDGALANDRILEIDFGDTATRLSVLWNTVLGKPQFQVWDNGTLQAAIAPPGNAISFGSPFRVAIAFAPNDFAVALNGSTVANDTQGSLPSGFDTLRLGRSIWGAQGLMIAESLSYYPARLGDAELQAITA